MSAPTIAPSSTCPSVMALELFAQYDLLRLKTYQNAEHLGERIRTRAFGTATALRFDDVGYFNRVYAPDGSLSQYIHEVEEFYRGCPFPCELVGPRIGLSDEIDEVCRRRGWVTGGQYAWLYSRTEGLPASDVSNSFQIRQPEERERTLFLTCYLKAFEAEPHRHAGAIRNMRHLFNQAGLSFLMAWKDGVPAGIAMMYQRGRSAVFCAGATLPEYREQDCHSALLAARIRLAIESECDEIFSWAIAGKQSERNMLRAGLQRAGITSAWRFPVG